MSDCERERAVCTHHVDCWQHLRNIFLAEMSAAQVIASGSRLPSHFNNFSYNCNCLNDRQYTKLHARRRRSMWGKSSRRNSRLSQRGNG